MIFIRALFSPLKLLVFNFLIIFFSNDAFGQKHAKVDSSGMVTLRLDPQSARGAKVSQLFDDVKFIPLETTKESLFGNISDLRSVKDRFVIYDFDTKAVLIFSKEGKFKGHFGFSNQLFWAWRL